MISDDEYKILKAAEKAPACFEDNFGNDSRLLGVIQYMQNQKMILAYHLNDDESKTFIKIRRKGEEALDRFEKEIRAEKREIKDHKLIIVSVIISAISCLLSLLPNLKHLVQVVFGLK